MRQAMDSTEEARIKHDEIVGYEAMMARLRALPNGQQIIATNFLEPDLEVAAKRFRDSEEWLDTVEALQPRPGAWVLDYGAGRCLSTAAFASLGCRVVALDISSSALTGLGVLKKYELFKQYPLNGVLGDAEHAMFRPEVFDIVYCREALHHAFDLQALVRHLVRLLKPGGLFYAYGEHRHPWWSSDQEFRKRHPAVVFGANEHSYTQTAYKKALLGAGLTHVKIAPVLSPLYITGYAPWYHRAILTTGKTPIIGRNLYRAYARAQHYRSVGSQVIIMGWK